MARLCVFPFEDEIEVTQNCIDDGLVPFSVGIAVDQDVVRFDICRIMEVSLKNIQAITFQIGENTRVN